MRDGKIIKIKKENGFTLVEVLVAIGILSFGLLAVAAMQNTALLGTGRSKSVTEATTVAMDRMERIFAIPFDTLTTSYTTGSVYDDGDFATAPPSPPSTITSVTWKFSNAPSLPSDSAKVIEVTVQSRLMKTPIVLKNIRIKLS